MRLWMWFSILAAPCLAQITLPDYLSPEAGGGEGPGSGRRPRHGAPVEEKEKTPEEEVDIPQRMLRQLQSSNLNLTLEPGPEKDDTGRIRKLETLYLGGPKVLRLVLQTGAGERLSGEVDNQTFGVRTSFGDFPVRLHDVARVGKLEDGRFRFEFKSGDLLEGRPLSAALSLLRMDGGRRVVGWDRVSDLRVLPTEK